MQTHAVQLHAVAVSRVWSNVALNDVILTTGKRHKYCKVKVGKR